jgi:hypothetical protein
MCAFFTIKHNTFGLPLVDCGGYYERVRPFWIHGIVVDGNYDPLCRFKDLPHDFLLSYMVEG